MRVYRVKKIHAMLQTIASASRKMRKRSGSPNSDRAHSSSVRRTWNTAAYLIILLGLNSMLLMKKIKSEFYSIVS